MADPIILPDPSVVLVQGGRMHPDWYRLFRLFADSYNASNASQATALSALETQVDGIDKLTARGDLLTRDASEYVRRAVGANGTIPTSDGTDWAWQSPAVSGGVETIVPSTAFPAAATVDIANIPATYAYLILHIIGASCDTATRAIMVQVSTNNGSSFDSGANYLGSYVTGGTTLNAIGVNSLIGGGAVAAAVAQTVAMKLFAYQGGSFPLAKASVTGGGAPSNGFCEYIGSTSAINALRILWNNTGSFDAGSYTLLGVK